MKRVAIIGGGISGLACAYELELARQHGAAIDWHLYEASDRLGGVVETTRLAAPEGDFILEGGPDGWVSEKTWARELAIELGLEAELIHSNDTTRKTYILLDGTLQAIPDHMRMMVPEDLSALDASPLFSESARQAYATEITRAEELKASAPDQDESVADFVRRHFGDEVLNTLAAPLLGGVFGGDVHKLSVRSVTAPFVAMEREQGSLVVALQERAKQRKRAPQPIFTSLRKGLATLTEALISRLDPARLHLGHPIRDFAELQAESIVLATSLDASHALLAQRSAEAASLLPTESSSALLAAFVWPEESAKLFTVPPGFGFLVPDGSEASVSEGHLLACTFVDQKFPQRAPAGARVIRAFFGGGTAEALSPKSDEEVAAAALAQLRAILGSIPEPTVQTVRRWPRSLPQYEVGHLERMDRLDALLEQMPGLHLLGNSYRGVGVPDLIRDARALARTLCT